MQIACNCPAEAEAAPLAWIARGRLGWQAGEEVREGRALGEGGQTGRGSEASSRRVLS